VKKIKFLLCYTKQGNTNFMKGKGNIYMAKEDEKVDQTSLSELFESISSEILTDSVKLQMETIFESALNEAIALKEEELEAKNTVEIEEFKESLIENIDSYMDYFSKEYIKENEAVVEDFNKVKLAEKVLRNFKQMCEAFNLSLSDESISSEDELEELKTEQNKLVNQLIEAQKETETVMRAAMIAEASVKLTTDIQIEKLFEKAKGLEFDRETFAEKLDILVDTILMKEAKSDEDADGDDKLEDQEEMTESKTQSKPISESMTGYLKYIK
jgi:hypothetical protein